MKLTKEQERIIASTGDIKINAVAGSGKTTTIIEYARTRAKSSKILYLAFNKSVKLEAKKRFADAGLHNVQVETAHSLAYRHIVFKKGYKVRAQGYKTHEIAELLQLQASGEKHAEYIVANHINRFIGYFCNSDVLKVQDLDYREIVQDAKAAKFVENFYDYIENQTRILLAKMFKGEIEITHDFYLKMFQLECPDLPFDYLLFDEGQDASAAMLDIFIKQKGTKVIVGDTHQQIYGWRFAVNSLEKTTFTNYHLSTSFRFSSEIAELATQVLDWKRHLQAFDSVEIKGKGTAKKKATKAIIARTNLGLLLQAIEQVGSDTDKKIYFEGNINSYTYADEGASLYDVLNLYNNKLHLIRDQLIKKMKTLEELEEYIKQTDDIQLSMMVDIVKEYGNSIPTLIKKLKDSHVDKDNKDEAQLIYSTVHRCKGMEYDIVQLVNDFISEDKIITKREEHNKDELDLSKLNEEINLLYVAITRTKNKLLIPETLVSTDCPQSSHIVKLLVDKKSDGKRFSHQKFEDKGSRINKRTNQLSVEQKRKTHRGAYQKWTAELDLELTMMYNEGKSIHELSKYFERTRGSIQARITKLELDEHSW